MKQPRLGAIALLAAITAFPLAAEAQSGARSWYLVGPPIVRNPGPSVPTDAPLSQWHRFVTYDTSAACAAGQREFAAWMAQETRALRARGDAQQADAMLLVQRDLRCIESDDPGLKR